MLALSILVWAAFAFGLYALNRWGLPLWVRYETFLLWDVPRMVDSRTNFR